MFDMEVCTAVGKQPAALFTRHTCILYMLLIGVCAKGRAVAMAFVAVCAPFLSMGPQMFLHYVSLSERTQLQQKYPAAVYFGEVPLDH